MSVFTEFERDPDASVGVMWRDFVQAVAMYVYTNEQSGQRVSVDAVAIAFNTTTDLAFEAAAEHPWLVTDGETIQSDGE